MAQPIKAFNFTNEIGGNQTNRSTKSVSMRGKDRRMSPRDELVESKTVKKLNQVPFKSMNGIQFCVDYAVGLPESSTATRVTARLLTFQRRQIGEPSAPSYSDPESDSCNPKYDLHMGWRGKIIHFYPLIFYNNNFLFPSYLRKYIKSIYYNCMSNRYIGKTRSFT